MRSSQRLMPNSVSAKNELSTISRWSTGRGKLSPSVYVVPRLGFASFGDAHVVRPRRIRAVGGRRPAVDAFLPGVGGLLVRRGLLGGAVAARDVGGADQAREVTRPDEVVRPGELPVRLQCQRAPDPRHRRRRDLGAGVGLV